jgi:hypothetical protein
VLNRVLILVYKDIQARGVRYVIAREFYPRKSRMEDRVESVVCQVEGQKGENPLVLTTGWVLNCVGAANSGYDASFD